MGLRPQLRSTMASLLLTTQAIRGVAFVPSFLPFVDGLPARSNTIRAKRSISDARSISEFSTSELKRLLTERGVDFRDCLEKNELVERLQSSLRSDESPDADIEAAKLASLSSTEQSTIKLFQRVAPSVAFITTTAVRQASPLSMRAIEVPQGSGSGFVWDNQGHIVTNYHVIQQAQRASISGLGVGVEDSMKSFDAVLVGAEPEKDIAVLKVNAPKSVLRPVNVGASNELLVGQSAFAIGNPFGLDHTLTSGIISAVGREVMGIGGRPIKGCIQTDCSINPGNSGGPLLDASGRLIGVNTAIYSPSGASAGIGFAIPIDTVRRIVNQIIRYGRVLRPSIGISVADDQVVRGLRARLGSQLEGVLVMDAPSGTPGGDAGLVGCLRRRDGALILGDLITKVDGKPVKNVEDLLNFIEELQVGSEVTLSVLRNAKPGKEENLRVKTVERKQLPANVRP
uniref:PDZ domain-containing protein n=1 Tax=Aureoumbra lagunensis TaxID=44058 RepID=A0A7S3K1E4_9STRA